MVVLFVFATIQEQRLDTTTRDAAALEQRVAEADRALQAAAAREQARTREQEARLAADQAASTALIEAQAEAERLREQLRQLEQDVVDEQAETRAALVRAGLPEQTLERLELLERLLDKHGVLEIEILGETDDAGIPRNRCCFRDDPLSDQWRACGWIPSLPEDRERWLDEGANGLYEALRRTKGGNALTLVRQDHDASYRVAASLAELVRGRFSDRYVDFKEELVLTARCGE